MDRIALLQELSDKIDDMKNRMSDKEYLDFCNILQKLFVDYKPKAPQAQVQRPQRPSSPVSSQRIQDPSSPVSSQRPQRPSSPVQRPQRPSSPVQRPQRPQLAQAYETTDCSAQRIIHEPPRIVEAFDIYTQGIQRVHDVNTNIYLLCPYCKIVTERILGCPMVLCGACKNRFIFTATSETHDSIPVGMKCRN